MNSEEYGKNIQILLKDLFQITSSLPNCQGESHSESRGETMASPGVSNRMKYPQGNNHMMQNHSLTGKEGKMKSKNSVVLLAGVLTILSCAVSYGEVEKWEFDDVDRITIKGISGDIILRPAEGTKGIVELREEVRPEDSFHAIVEYDRGDLDIREKWRGSNRSGSVEWTIYLPKQTHEPRVRINSASGSLDCSGIAARIDFQTASGEVVLSDVSLGEGSDFRTASGEYRIENMSVSEDVEFSTASGDVELENLTIEDGCRFSTASGNVRCLNCRCQGDVEMSSASGDVVLKETQLGGRSDFSSASGDVSLDFNVLPGHDLSAGSASGDVELRVGEFGGDFRLVLIKRADEGRITCPFDYTSEETFEENGHLYEKKTVSHGSGQPEIKLRTASGRVAVRNE